MAKVFCVEDLVDGCCVLMNCVSILSVLCFAFSLFVYFTGLLVGSWRRRGGTYSGGICRRRVVEGVMHEALHVG